MAKTLQTAIKKRFKHGLIVGKFFPPHEGHLYLIRSAAQFCKKVTVIIDDHSHPTLPVDIREQAIVEAIEFRNVHVESSLRKFLQSRGKTIDAFFTSGNKYAFIGEKLKSTVVNVDRSVFPITSAYIRENTTASWSSILQLAQSYMCKRVVIVGSESSGKTTLCELLASHYHDKGGAFGFTPHVPEFGREYTYSKLAIEQGIAFKKKQTKPGMDNLVWSENDFIQIAKVQNEWENEATKKGSPLIICDTDSFATAIWHERYRGNFPKSFQKIIRELPKRLLYVIANEKEVKFAADEIRDGESYRTWMREKFESELVKNSFNYIVASGTPEIRTKTVASEIQKRLVWNWN